MSQIPWGQFARAYKAIHDAILSELTSVPEGKKITKQAFTWNPDGSLATLKAYDGETLLFTLSFTWDASGNLTEVARS